MRSVLKNTLRDKTDSYDIYMRGTDCSYYYESYIGYKTEEL